MPTVEKETVVTPTSGGSGPGVMLALVVAIIVLAIAGYFVYAVGFHGNGGGPSVIEHNTTITPPAVPTGNPIQGSGSGTNQ